MELEVPEIYDRTVEIQKIVREAGYRTKIAVYSNRDDVDPVGACVGLKGVRIQAVIRELEGEKIDVLKYDEDPRVFIRNALSPAEVNDVVILDEEKRTALAVVSEQQFSLAIGKQGLNVRLANRLADWSIDVKTDEQFAEMDLSADYRLAANNLFSDAEPVDEIVDIAELPGITPELVAVFASAGITTVEQLFALDDEGLRNLEGMTEDMLAYISGILTDEAIEVIEQKDESVYDGDSVEPEVQTAQDDTAAVEEEYECPECGAKITIDMTTCPSCGIGLSFEYEDEE